MHTTRSQLRHLYLRLQSKSRSRTMDTRLSLFGFSRLRIRHLILSILAVLITYTFLTTGHADRSLSWITGDSTRLELPSHLIDYERAQIKQISPSMIDYLYEHTDKDAVDWGKLAYVTYATSETHLCNVLMMFSRLRNFKTRAQLVLVVSDDVVILSKPMETLKTLGVTIKRARRVSSEDKGSYWASSLTKMAIFGLTEYDRIVYMDADAQLTKSHLDELFFIPPAEMAAVPSYWLLPKRFDKSWWTSLLNLKTSGPGNWEPPRPMTHQERKQYEEQQVHNISLYSDYSGVIPVCPSCKLTKTEEYMVKEKNFYNLAYNSLRQFHFLRQFRLTSILMVITPSESLQKRALETLLSRSNDEFDMEMVNKLYPFIDVIKRQRNRIDADPLHDIPDFLILPQQVYGMLTFELNMERKHMTFLADVQDLPYIGRSEGRNIDSSEKAYYDFSNFENESEQWFDKVKYVHFSDWDIPKPWMKKDPHAEYMSTRRRCKPLKEGLTKDPSLVLPGRETADCKAAEYWEKIHADFARERLEVCGLPLLDADMVH